MWTTWKISNCKYSWFYSWLCCGLSVAIFVVNCAGLTLGFSSEDGINLGEISVSASNAFRIVSMAEVPDLEEFPLAVAFQQEKLKKEKGK